MTEETITRSSWPSKRPARVRLAIVALTCGGAVLMAGCTSSSTAKPSSANKAHAATSAAAKSPTASPATSGMPKAAVCVHINSIRTSLTSLTHVKVTSTSASRLSTDLSSIQAHLSALKGQNLGAFSPEAKELTAELDRIKKDAAGLSTNPSKAAKQLNADLTSFKRQAGPMVAEMRKICHVS